MINRAIDLGITYFEWALGFTGIHIMDPEFLGHISGKGYSDIIDCYRNLIRAGESINAFSRKGITGGTLEA